MARAVAKNGSIGWLIALGGSLLATLLTIGLMFWARDHFQVRTLPERMLEYVLLFITPENFEKGLAALGEQAKVVGLYMATAIMGLILLGLGLVAIGRHWSAVTVAALAPLLYLVAMAGIMPLTGGGVFASAPFQNTGLVNAVYATVALIYATVLLLTRMLLPATGTPDAAAMSVTRRAFCGSAAGAVAALAASFWFNERGVTSSLPTVDLDKLPPAPRPAASPAAGTPSAAGLPAAPLADGSPGPAAASPVAAAVATTTELPLPLRPPKSTARDKDGSLVGSQRQPGELAPAITPNTGFYITTKNPVADPVVKPDGWRLVLDGELNKPLQLDLRTLRRLPSIEVTKTMECVSNFATKCEIVPFGCELIGTAYWKGVRLIDLFDLAGGLKSGVTHVTMYGSDEFVSTVAIEAATDPETLVVYEMNGEPLPYEHGYPARLLTPGRYGYKSAKWLLSIQPTVGETLDWYGQRGWSKEGLVRTLTRIDTPAFGATVPAGPTRLAGIAYAGLLGIQKVEVSPDNGQTWREAQFVEPPAGRDTWIRWQITLDLPASDSHVLLARSTDGNGALQPEEFSFPDPVGASGWNRLELKATA
jgi:DMSO/TMAO reductase YedYZ molybdopterin-dependent catalytic subunit